MILISGPSTIGKNPLIEKMCSYFNCRFIVPWTTRPMRKEENGKTDYHFVSNEMFQSYILNGKIIEWDFVLSNYYGFSDLEINTTNSVTHCLSRMALRIKKSNPSKITTIFLMPSNKARIVEVLKTIYSGTQLALREALVDEEILHSSMFDYVFKIEEKSSELLNNKRFLKLVEENK